MYRFVKSASELVSSSKKIQVASLLGEACRGIHSSAFCLQDQSPEQFDIEEPQSLPNNRTYRNSVTMVGDVASKPMPLYRDGELNGYKLKIMTVRRFRSRDGSMSREMQHYHEASCFSRRHFPLIEDKLKVNDQVVIHGSLANSVSRNFDEVSYKTVIRINDMQVVAEDV